MSGTTLTGAAAHYYARPEDERFWDLADLEATLADRRQRQREIVLGYGDFAVVPKNGKDIALELKNGATATLNDWAFDQLMKRLDIAPTFARTFQRDTVLAMMRERMNVVTQTQLPAPVEFEVPDEWSDVSSTKVDEGTIKLLIQLGDDPVVQSITSDQYGRYWSIEMCRLLRKIETNGWRVPPGRARGVTDEVTRVATQADVLRNQDISPGGIPIKEGDLLCRSGVYHSTRNDFVFLVDDGNPIEADGTVLKRGLFASNSEVGESRKAKLTTFLYESVCGNHYVWGASGVRTVERVHRKGAIKSFEDDGLKMLDGINDGAADDAKAIAYAKKLSLGTSKDEVVDTLLKDYRSEPMMRKGMIEASYDLARSFEHASNAAPNTVFGMVYGMTMVSQRTRNVDVRDKLDTLAGVVLSRARLEYTPTTVAANITVTEDGEVVGGSSTTKKRGRKTG